MRTRSLATIAIALMGLSGFLTEPAMANRPDGHTTLPQSSPLLKQMCGGFLILCTWCSSATKNCYRVTDCDGDHCSITILFPDAVLKPTAPHPPVNTGPVGGSGKAKGKIFIY